MRRIRQGLSLAFGKLTAAFDLLVVGFALVVVLLVALVLPAPKDDGGG